MGEPSRLTVLGLGIRWPPPPAVPGPVGVPPAPAAAAPPAPVPVVRPAGDVPSQATSRANRQARPKPNPRARLVKALGDARPTAARSCRSVCIFIRFRDFVAHFATITAAGFRAR